MEPDHRRQIGRYFSLRKTRPALYSPTARMRTNFARSIINSIRADGSRKMIYAD
jgi:hypothetical protein